MDFSDNFKQLVNKTESLAEYTLEELEHLLAESKEIENQYDNMQLVVKCNANSLYGVSASVYFSLCDVDIAEDITMTAKHFTVIVDRAINNFYKNWGETELKKIQEFYPNVSSLRPFTEYEPDTKNDICIYGDTDSRYLDLSRIYSLLIEDGKPKNIPPNTPEGNIELGDFSVFLSENFHDDLIKKTIDDECEFRNAVPGKLVMNHEITARRCIYQKKKKYIMTGIWQDGKHLKKPKIKFMGVELKRGSSSPRSKKILTKLVEKFLLDDFSIDMLRLEVIKLIKYIKSRKDIDFLYLISSVSGLQHAIKDDDGVYRSEKNHIQMQIALSWYNFIEKNGLQEQYQPPFENQKMNYYYCNPNSGYKVIGVPDDVDITKVKNMPEPDWNKMINKALVKPLLRYVYDKAEIDDVDVEHFILGVKLWDF